jgi:hypothetical protein
LWPRNFAFYASVEKISPSLERSALPTDVFGRNVAHDVALIPAKKYGGKFRLKIAQKGKIPIKK